MWLEIFDAEVNFPANYWHYFERSSRSATRATQSRLVLGLHRLQKCAALTDPLCITLKSFIDNIAETASGCASGHDLGQSV